MNTDTARTSITIKPSLLARLRLFARHHDRTVSDVVEQGVTQVLANTDEPDVDSFYRELARLEGIGTSDRRYKNMSVDEILYGEQGEWRGDAQ